MASDEVTIDVGPVWCPSCKREFGSTERDAEVSALRAALERAALLRCAAALPGVDDPTCVGYEDPTDYCPGCAARDALGRYPKEASDG